MRNKYKWPILGWFKNRYYKIISGGVLIQLVWVFILFIIIFFAIKFVYDMDGDLLFQEMTEYHPEGATVPERPLKMIYLIGVVFFGGLLVMVLTNGIRNRIDRIEAGDVHYSFSNHVVVLGYNEIARGVIKNLCSKKKHLPIVVIVESNLRAIREETIGLYGTNNGIYFQHGCRTRLDDLRSFRLHLAREIFIIGENEAQADSMNLECYRLLSEIPDASNWKAYLYLYLNEPASVALISNRRYAKTKVNILDFNHRLQVYNTEERWARRILVDSMNQWPAMNMNMRGDRRLTMDSDDRIHLVVFGMTNAGEMIAKTAAQTCHHPNFITKGIRTRITIIDEDLDTHRGILHGRYSDYMKLCHYSVRRIKDGVSELIYTHVPPTEYDFLDIEWEFIESIPDDMALQNELAEWCERDNDLMTVVVCNSDEKKNMDIALGLPKVYYDYEVPVWLYSKSQYSIQRYLDATRYSNVVMWGMQGDRPTQALWEEVAAKWLNFKYSHWNHFGKVENAVEIEESWSGIPIDARMFCIVQMSGVPSIVGSLRHWSREVEHIEIDEDEWHVFSKLEHIRWSTCMLLDGYRPATMEQTIQVLIGDKNQANMLKNQLIRSFYHPFITDYKLLNPEFIEMNRNMIRFYISVIN